MTNDGLKERVLELLRDTAPLLDMTVAEYFSDTGGLDKHQLAVISQKGEMTLHELLVWTTGDDSDDTQSLDDFAVLAEIARLPMNHLDSLYNFYEAQDP